MTSIIGDGIVSGWDIQTLTFPNIRVTKGGGFINQFYVETLDDKEFTLNANSTARFYAQNRVGILGTSGPKSDVVSFTYSDVSPPSPVQDFTALSPSSDLYFTINLSWSKNSEIDLDHYEIDRSLSSDSSFKTIANVDKDSVTYSDSVEEDTTYYYKIYAVDQSGFRSDPSLDNETTLLSPNIPPNPMDVIVAHSESGINILWKRPEPIEFSKIDHWDLTYIRLNSDLSEIDSTLTNVLISKYSFNERIDDLINGETYKITLKTVDTKSRKSTGVTQNSTPQPSPAPKDPQAIEAIETEGPSGVIINLSWTDGADVYDPLIPYRYNIYITVEGSPESAAISVPIGETSEQIDLYSFDLINYFSIPQKTLVTFRITSVTNNGIESFGNYIRFITDNFTQPLPVSNLRSSFNIDSSKITILWNNNDDTDSARLKVNDEDLDIDYPASDIIDKNIGLVSKYIFDAEINHKYTITVTAIDADGVLSLSNVIVELTIIPGGVSSPELPIGVTAKAGDRSINLSWRNSKTASVVSYKIYFKSGKTTVQFDDWSLLETVPKNITSFDHFGLENNTVYSYYITSVDIYGNESNHLNNNFINLNFIEIKPKASGILTEPDNVLLSLTGNDVQISWSALLEEFDSFAIYRSVGNLYSWEQIATTDRETTSYTDDNVPLVHNTTFYYTVVKNINDADIVVQSSNVAPENSIFIGQVLLLSSDFGSMSNEGVRHVVNLEDPIKEYTNIHLLSHKHLNKNIMDPDRIDLEPNLIVTDWSTVDGRIFTTREVDISGESYSLRINNRFPSTFFTIDAKTNRIVFSEPIVSLNSDGNIIGDIPFIELKISGIEEVQGELESNRFDKIHARQVAFGRLNQEQIPDINHEGRIKENLVPKNYLLERFDDNTFVVPENNEDETKNFGNGTTFFSVIESDGLIEEVINFDNFTDGSSVGFRKPSFSPTTSGNVDTTFDISEVVSDQAFQSEKAYHFKFSFVDNDPTRWVRITTVDTDNIPNPILDLKKRIRFRVLLESGSIRIALGIREIDKTTATVGGNGGSNGPIEWVGADEFILNENNDPTPIGKLIQSTNTDIWQEVEFDLEKDHIINFSGGNGILEGSYGTLEHIAFTIVPESISPGELINIHIDKIEQVDDVLVSGTSQGILISRDFGSSWSLSRLVETPVHRFYRGVNNKFLWAISSNSVLLAVDPANWFETSGLLGVGFIRDITEDSFGNMYISTDKGVYWFEIAIVTTFSSWRQTSPINAFTNDCYGLYHSPGPSGIDEIWVSTEIGIFTTTDNGDNWVDSGMSTQGIPAFQIINISEDSSYPNIIAINRKHVLRKMSTDDDFVMLANLEVQHNITKIWKMEYFSGHIYISSEKGVYMNSLDELFIPTNITIPFDRIFPDLDFNGFVGIAFGLDKILVNDEHQLFIGQENRLMMSTELNVLTIKDQFPNKDLPSFYKDGSEIFIGYIYNSFNNVLSFREPQPTDSVYRSAHIPRKKYSTANGGWAQTNANTDVFLFVNGIPRWLDFKLDESSILSELQLLESKLLPIRGQLDSFNSLTPLSDETLSKTIQDINTIKLGGTPDSSGNMTSLINSDTVSALLNNYTRFLSLIKRDVVSKFNLTNPEINIIGFPRESRAPGGESRADILESKENFMAKDSTGIIIDTLSGFVDFLTVFQQSTNLDDRLNFVFTKYDDLSITIFNSNVKNIGEFNHVDIEDKFELKNTGLTSNLSRSYYANLIKAGIFLESNYNNLFSSLNTSNVQSKYFTASNNDWYDTINSTIDYKSILKVENNPESRFSNFIYFFTENPYLTGRFWVGTDSDIYQYQFEEQTGDMVLDDIIRPGNGANSLFIWDIFVLSEDDIYVVAEDKILEMGKIFRTIDAGGSWEELETINLPKFIYNFGIINGNKVVGTENGLFYSDNNFGTWTPANLNLSPQLGINSPSVSAFTQRILNLSTSIFIMAESNGWFYTSGSGLDWFGLSGQLTSNNIGTINKIIRFKNLTWAGTDNGLYNDGNSILSDSIQFGLQTDLESTTLESSKINISDIVHGEDAIYCSSSSTIYRFLDDSWVSYKIPNVSGIHKILIHETLNKHYLIVISHSSIQPIDVTPGSGVFG